MGFSLGLSRKLKLFITARWDSGGPSWGLDVSDPLGIKTLCTVIVNSYRVLWSFLHFSLRVRTSLVLTSFPVLRGNNGI